MELSLIILKKTHFKLDQIQKNINIYVQKLLIFFKVILT